MASRCLRRVSQKELPALKERLAAHLPKSAVVHGTVELGVRYGLLEKLGTRLYVPEGGGGRLSSMVVATPTFTTKKLQSLSVFWNTEEDDDEEELAQLLSSLPRWDWRRPVFFSIGPKTMSNKLERVANHSLLGGGHVRVHQVDDSHMTVYNSTKLPPAGLPEGFYFDILRPEDIPLITSHWDYRWTETHNGLETLLKNVPTVAVRKMGDHQVGENGDKGVCGLKTRPGDQLVSWMYVYNNGILGHGYTLANYRRRYLYYEVLNMILKEVHK